MSVATISLVRLGQTKPFCSLTPILMTQVAFPKLSDTLMKVVRHKRKDKAF